MSAAFLAGKKPAKTPERININSENIITGKSILALVNKESFALKKEVIIQFNKLINNAPNMRPIAPAIEVITMDSVIIIQMIDFDFAPMALRMPISKVRSFTITSIILLIPTMPLNKRHKPINHKKISMPLNNLSNAFI